MKKSRALLNLKYSLLLAMFIVSFGTTHVLASDQDFYSSNDILYYDPDACATTASSGSSVTIEGSDNLEKILRYLTGKGLTLAQAAGIAGNMKQESGFDPTIIQGGAKAGPDYKPVNSVGFGLVQWTFTSRQKPLVDLANSTNRKVIDISVQLDYVWKELSGPYKKSTLDPLSKETDPVKAAVIVHDHYEVSADSAAAVVNVRGGNATAIYNKYKGSIQDGSGVSGATEGGSTASTTPGNPCAGQANNGNPSSFSGDGFAIFNQCDPKWANNPFGTSKICPSGCGPSSMAMIITALTGKTVTPAETVAYANQKGIYIPGSGSSWSVAPVLAEHWGLKAHNIKNTVAEVNKVLSSGGLVVTSGQGASPFTTGGHYITIRGLTSSGKWKIGDSNGQKGIANSDKEWDPQYILDIANGSNVVAITK